MGVYRADLYLTAMIRDLDLDEHSQQLFAMLKNIPEMNNLSIIKMSRGNEDWYDIIGSINVPEHARAFEALCRETTIEDAYNLFMRIDRNIAAESYDAAQLKAKGWIQRIIARPLMERFQTAWVRIESPLERTKPTLRRGV